MLSGLAQTGTKALGGARFSLVNLAPPTFVVGFVTLLSVSGLYAGRPADLSATISDLSHNVGWSVIAVFGVFLLGVLLRPFQMAMVQWLEGYWRNIRLLRQVHDLAVERHRRTRHTATVVVDASVYLGGPTVKLDELAIQQRHRRRLSILKSKADAIYLRYPDPAQYDTQESDDRLMPTLLGNAFRDGEDNAGLRYGLRLQVVAPRLYPSISPTLSRAIAQNLDLIDTTAAMCIAFILTTLGSLPLVGRWDWWSWLPAGTAIMAVLAYRGSIRMARGHARLLATAVDLHRFDMLKALHYRLPKTTEEEFTFNRKLSRFLDSHETAVRIIGTEKYDHATINDKQGEKDGQNSVDKESADSESS